MIASRPDVEHSVSMMYYEDEGVYRLDTIRTGTNTVAPIGGRNQGVVASVHSHPASNPFPPSGLDILTTAECAKDNPDFKYLYTYAGNAHYALYVEDRSKAMAFYERHKNEIDRETNMFVEKTKLDKDFDVAFNKLSKLSETNQFVFALAYVLENNDSGIRLLRKEAGITGFSAIGVKHEAGGPISPIECK